MTPVEKFAQLNDLARAGFGSMKFYITAGIAALPEDDQHAIMLKVVQFNDFTPDNDPYGDHDFGAFDHAGQRIFWKIDYYAKGDMTRGSERPDDPEATTRVLTIMLASEY